MRRRKPVLKNKMYRFFDAVDNASPTKSFIADPDRASMLMYALNCEMIEERYQQWLAVGHTAPQYAESMREIREAFAEDEAGYFYYARQVRINALNS